MTAHKASEGMKDKNTAIEELSVGSGIYSTTECETLKNGAVACETLMAVVKAAFDASEKLIMRSLTKTLENEDFASHLNEGIIRYLYAAALLSLTGKEINRKSLADVIRSLDIKPNYKFIDILLSTNIKGHLVYVYAYYYLLVNGSSVSEQKLMNAVEALGLRADRRTAAETLKFVQQ